MEQPVFPQHLTESAKLKQRMDAIDSAFERTKSYGLSYELVYACFFADGEIVGFTRSAEDACEWASRVAANNKGVRIIKIYEIKNPHKA